MSARRLAAVTFLVLAGGTAGSLEKTPSGAVPTSLILITLDTTRADRLGCYGYREGRTPRLDRLASEGAIFEAAVAVTPLTLPAHASILTGLYPPRHGVRDNGDFRLPDRDTTLAEHLKARGFATAAVVGSAVLASSQGLAQGFDTYDEPRGSPSPAVSGVVYQVEAERPASEVTDAALAVISRLPAGRFFLWVHYFDPHLLYAPPPPWSERFAGRPYDGEIAYMDAEIGRLLDGITARGRMKDTLIAVVGDHGEALGDHGERTHGLLVYDATIRVPLLLRLPGRIAAGSRFPAPVSQVDLLPTMLDLIRTDPLGGVQGKSFAAGITGGRPVVDSSPVYAESLYGERSHGWAPLRVLREGDRKFIDAPEPEIYDLASDPGETRNLAPSRPSEVSSLLSRLSALVGTMGEPHPSARSPLTEERRKMLESLGYVVSGEFSTPAPRVAAQDPKRGIALYELFIEARDLIARGRVDEAQEKLEKLLAADPGNPLALSSLGSLLVGSGAVEEGLRRLQAASEAAPGVYEIQLNTARQLRNVGRHEEAAHAFRAAIAIRPSSFEAHHGLGKALYAMRDPRGAVREYLEAIRLGGDCPPVRAALGLARIAAADADEAERDLRKAEGADARILTEAWKQLGWFRAREGNLEGARRALESALALAPLDPAALLDHATVCAKMGDGPASGRSLDRLLAADPDHPSARMRLAEFRAAAGDREGAAAAAREFLTQPGADPKLFPAARALLDRLRTGG